MNIKKHISVLVLMLCVVASVRVASSDYFSPLTLVPGKDNQSLYIVEATGKKVDAIDLKTKKVDHSLKLSFYPQGLAFDRYFADFMIVGGGHAGRAATMKDVLTTYNKDDKHGLASGLTPEELNDLVEFVLSL